MILDLAERIGLTVRTKAQATLYGMGFFFQVLRESFLFFRKNQVGYKVLVMQLLFTGVEALGIVTLLSLVLGASIIIQGFPVLAQFGQTDLLYTVLVIVITRELGPLLTAFVIIARSGTAIATELGGMIVSHEVEAYVSFGINPISYLIVPRVLGVVFSMLLLSIYFSFSGLILSYLVASFTTALPASEYLTKIAQALSVKDLVFSLLKSAVFGALISLSASYQGFLVQGSSTEIPQAGIKAVGKSFTFIIIADVILSALYYIGT